MSQTGLRRGGKKARMRLLPVFEKGERVLAAVSGGADSTALLLLLAQARDLGEIALCCAHFCHGIRSNDRADRDFVRAMCQRLNVPFFEGAGDAPDYARLHRCGLETAAREMRRAFLLRTMKETGCAVIATAHHADDQAETVLMHLLRGGGLRGASGMKPRNGAWARPLLETDKREILAFLAERRQSFCEDVTNAVADNPRNALRLCAMPPLKAIYPAAAKSLSRFARIAADEDDYMALETRAWLNSHARRMPFGTRLTADASHPALVRRALRALLGDGPDGPDFALLSSLLTLYFDARGAIQTQRVRAERTGGYLYLIDRSVRPFEGEIPLSDGARLPGLGTFSLRAALPEAVKDDPYRQVVRRDALFGAVARVRRPGDRMHMLGAPGDKLLSDILTDRKIDRPLRDYLPLVAAGNRILWIPGVCLSREAALNENTVDAAQLRFEREEP